MKIKSVLTGLALAGSVMGAVSAVAADQTGVQQSVPYGYYVKNSENAGLAGQPFTVFAVRTADTVNFDKVERTITWQEASGDKQNSSQLQIQGKVNARVSCTYTPATDKPVDTLWWAKGDKCGSITEPEGATMSKWFPGVMNINSEAGKPKTFAFTATYDGSSSRCVKDPSSGDRYKQNYLFHLKGSDQSVSSNDQMKCTVTLLETVKPEK